MTDDLLAEIENEVRMLSILRHPNIVLLMGVATKPPNMAILFENVPVGCLFNYLHLSKIDIPMDVRLRIARDVACVF
jgi:serine/threonine protein kinase